MKVYNQTKTQELNSESLDFEQGYLISDKRFVAHHDAIIGKSAEAIAQELIAQGEICNFRSDGNWYKQIKEYVGGGTDEEPIYPTESIDAYDEYEDIQVYVPYTEAELAQREITQLKQKLSSTDYQAIKYAEGEMSEYEYAPIKAQRAEWRRQINELEKKI